MSKVITENEAVSRLQTGALGVGEEHLSAAAAREFTKSLIEQGHVRALFLECNSDAQAAFDNEVKGNSSNPASNIKQIVDNAGPQWFGAGLSLGDVALVAVGKGIPVHFIDLNIPRKTKKPNPAKRDEHAADLFDKAAAGIGGQAGCLVHYGMVHLDRSKDTRNESYYYDDRWLGDRVDLGIVLFDEQ